MLIFLLIYVGPSMSGKSYLLKQIITRRNEVFSEPIDKIVYIYKIYQPLYDEMKNDDDVIFSTDDNVIQDYVGLRLVIVYDDFLIDVISSPRKMQERFLVSKHHQGYFLFFLAQSIFFQNNRLIMLNTEYIFLFRFRRDGQTAKRLMSQLDSSIANDLFAAYKECTIAPHKYFFISMHVKDSDVARYRNSIFVDDKLVIYGSHGSVY